MEQFTASEVRRQASTFGSGRVNAMLNVFADMLEAREKAVPVAEVVREIEKPGFVHEYAALNESLTVGTKLYTHPQPAQDGKDAARYSTGDRVTWTNRFGTSFNGEIREHNPETYGIEFDDGTYVDRAFPDDIHCAMAKESGR